MRLFDRNQYQLSQNQFHASKIHKEPIHFAFLSSQIYNTVHADKQIYWYTPPPFQTKSVEGLEFGLKHKYFFPSENDELKPK